VDEEAMCTTHSEWMTTESSLDKDKAANQIKSKYSQLGEQLPQQQPKAHSPSKEPVSLLEAGRGQRGRGRLRAPRPSGLAH
jgi:hypothetical protein